MVFARHNALNASLSSGLHYMIGTYDVIGDGITDKVGLIRGCCQMNHDFAPRYRLANGGSVGDIRERLINDFIVGVAVKSANQRAS